MNLSLEWTNLPEFLERVGAGVEAKKAEGVERVAELAERVADDMRSLAPVGSGEEDTPGELQDSIDVKRDGEDMLVGSFGVPYAKYVEFGTSKMRAEPFARPALAAVHRAFGK